METPKHLYSPLILHNEYNHGLSINSPQVSNDSLETLTIEKVLERSPQSILCSSISNFDSLLGQLIDM